MHQLGTAAVDHRRDRGAVDGLGTTIIDDGADGFTGLLNQLRAAVVEVGAGYRTGNNLIAAAKDSGIGGGTPDVNMLATAAVYCRILGETTVVDKLRAAGINNTLD